MPTMKGKEGQCVTLRTSGPAGTLWVDCTGLDFSRSGCLKTKANCLFNIWALPMASAIKTMVGYLREAIAIYSEKQASKMQDIMLTDIPWLLSWVIDSEITRWPIEPSTCKSRVDGQGFH